jgi:hypothetical protein
MKNNLRLSTIAAVSAASLLSGCGTIFTGTTQSVNVKTVDSANNTVVSGANCQVTDGHGVNYPVTSPGNVIVEKGKGPLQVNCQRRGYAAKQVGVPQQFNAVSVVNVLFWPGFIVDAVTGSMQRYPGTVTVNLDANNGKRSV